MKLQITLFIFLFLLNGYDISYAQSPETTCPKANDVSIFTLYGLLTNSELEPQRVELGFNNYSVDNEKLNVNDLQQKPDLPDFLRSYLEEMGVKQITESNICKKISNALDTNKKNESLKINYLRTYYETDDNYVVIYTSRKTKMGPGSLPAHPVLDKNFNIIGKIALRLKKKGD